MHTTHHLNDEHMQLYEWSGAGTGMPHSVPAGARRSHPWHASYAVLAVLTTLLILDGSGRSSPAGQASGPGERAGTALLPW